MPGLHASYSVRIPYSSKEDLEQLSIQLQAELGRRLTIPDVIAALVATARKPDLVKHLRR